MKLLSIIALLLASLSALATEQLEECSARYSVQLGATYPSDVAVQCTADEMSLITHVIHSVVELDSIAAQLSNHVPEFRVQSQQYGDGVTVDPTGTLVAPPDAEEIIQHLTEEDMEEDLYYEGGVANEGDGHRDLRKLVSDAVEHGAFPEAVDQDHRQAQLMNCGDLNGCSAEWCCQICGYCWDGGRRRQLEQLEEEAYAGLRGTPEVQDTSVVDEALQTKIKQHEERVSDEIEKKMRYMARKEAVPCLGNFWQIEVSFKLNL